MKNTFFLFLALLVLTLAKAQQADADFRSLTSLSGTWCMNTSKGMICETWKTMTDSVMYGFSVKISGTDSTLLEEVTIKKRNNTLLYIPVVSNQNNGEAVEFTLVSTENGQFIFENKAHDFPQRIVYTLPAGDKLTAWIEGTINGHFRKSEFMYTRSR